MTGQNKRRNQVKIICQVHFYFFIFLIQKWADNKQGNKRNRNKPCKVKARNEEAAMKDNLNLILMISVLVGTLVEHDNNHKDHKEEDKDNSMLEDCKDDSCKEILFAKSKNSEFSSLKRIFFTNSSWPYANTSCRFCTDLLQLQTCQTFLVKIINT